jgi:CubicO group peptidase (beta-lactamase class C family)
MPGTEHLTHPLVEAALAEAVRTTEVGIQVAAYHGDELIVDAYAGLADPHTRRAVDSETLFFPFSVTKSVTATALHLQAERGLVDYDAPVATYWPEYGANGKDAITVRHVLTHQSGAPWMPDGVTPERQADWDWMIHGFEQMSPDYPVGTNCYHALGWGWIIGEIIRRTDPQRRDFARFVREELLQPLGITDMYFGLPESEDYRLAKLSGGEIPESGAVVARALGLDDDWPLFFKGMPREVHPSAVVFNEEIARRTVHPGAGVITNARSMAAHFALLANKGSFNGVRLLSAECVESFLTPRENPDEIDLYLNMRVPVSAYGYYLSDNTPGMIPIITPGHPFLWMPGAGSSVGWAELDTGLGVAIAHNKMQSYDQGPHPYVAIAEAVRAVAADRQPRASGAISNDRHRKDA